MHPKLKKDLLVLVRSYVYNNIDHHVPSLKSFLSDFERAIIEQALQTTGGQQNRAARLLGLRESTLCEKMKRHGMRRPCAAAAEFAREPQTATPYDDTRENRRESPSA